MMMLAVIVLVLVVVVLVDVIASLDIYVFSGHCAVGSLQVLRISPYRGGAAEIFRRLNSFCFYLQEKEGEKGAEATPIVFLTGVGLPAPRRLATAPTLHGPASLTPPPP